MGNGESAEDVAVIDCGRPAFPIPDSRFPIPGPVPGPVPGPSA